MKNVFIIALCMLGIGVESCSKVPGCMDMDAENYNFQAEEDDGTCSYRGSAVFYHGQQTSQNLIDAGVTNVKLYVDDNFWDFMSPNIYFSFVPQCEHPDAMLMQNYGIGNQKTKDFNYQIKDQDNFILATGTFQIIGNQCNAIEYHF